MTGYCFRCAGSRVIRQPRILDVTTERYVVQGECGTCGTEVQRIVP